MAKFLYVQDGHTQGINSQSRLGDYFSDWLLKFDEIISLAQQHKCEAILDGGDLLETKKPAYTILDEIADRIEKGGIPLYSLLGNHAMHCGHIENSIDTGLYHLQKRSKMLHYLRELGNKNDDYRIIGIDYFYDIEDWLKNTIFDRFNYMGKELYTIYIIHAMITPKPFFKNASYIVPKDIKGNADLILCSHYHHSFSQKIGNTEFLNIGCFGRLNITEANIEPSVLLLDTEKRSYEIIKLKSAKPGNQVFDLIHHAEAKLTEKNIDDFITSLQGTEFITLDLLGQLEKLVKEGKVELKVKDHIIQKIGEIKNG